MEREGGRSKLVLDEITWVDDRVVVGLKELKALALGAATEAWPCQSNLYPTKAAARE
jgi:hypothetical protein